MCPVFSRKTFFRFFDGLFRISTRKTIAEPTCLFRGHDGRAICATKHLKLVHVHHLANAYTGSNNSLRGTKDILRETKTVFRDTHYSLRGTKHFKIINATFRGCYDDVHAKQNILLENYTCLLNAVLSLQYDNIVHVYTCDTNVDNSLVSTNSDSVNQCIEHSQLCTKVASRRVRNREPSRVSF